MDIPAQHPQSWHMEKVNYGSEMALIQRQIIKITKKTPKWY